MTVFPEMSDIYFADAPMEVSPALLVRLSMSIPLVFYPVKVTSVTKDPHLWQKKAHYFGVSLVLKRENC